MDSNIETIPTNKKATRINHLREGGTYLITGGLGQVGLTLAEAIAADVHAANIILVSRSQLPERSKWFSYNADNKKHSKIVQVIKGIRNLEQLGACVAVYAADVTNVAVMRKLIYDVRHTFGPINGVIHAAAFADTNYFPFLQESNIQQIWDIMSAKVLGTRVLADVLDNENPDFIILCSSLSTVIGGLRFGPYVSANTFLDAFATQQHARGKKAWISVAWEVWNFEEEFRHKATSLQEFAITPEEGKELFWYALAIGGPRVIVSTADLQKREDLVRKSLRGGEEDKLTASSLSDAVISPLSQDDCYEKVAEVVASVVGTIINDGHQNLIALGVDSLMMVQIVFQLKSKLGIEVPIVRAFDALTLAKLKALCWELINQQKDNNKETSLPITSENDKITRLINEDRVKLDQIANISRKSQGQAPLSSAQERLWFLSQLEPENPFYNVALVWKLSGSLDFEKIYTAVCLLLKRHSSLRSVFKNYEGEPMQFVVEPATFNVTLVDLSPLGPEKARSQVTALSYYDATTPFNLAHGPIVRPRIIRISFEEHYVLFTVHHIVMDAWSAEILRGELFELLTASSLGRPPKLPNLPITYSDYAQWQKANLSSLNTLRQQKYWLEHLSGLAELQLPTDKPLPSTPFGIGKTFGLQLNEDFIKKLRLFGEQEKSTLYIIMVAALNIVLHYWSGQDDIVIGTNVANRRHKELANIVGYFANVLVLRNQISKELTVREFLEKVRKNVFDALENQELPYVKLVQLLNPPRKQNRSPIFSVMFTFFEDRATISNDIQARVPALVTERVLLVDQGPVKFDLSVNVEVRSYGIDIIFVYAADIFERHTIERLGADLKAVLSEMATSLLKPISSFKLAPNRNTSTTTDVEQRAKFENLRKVRRSRN